MIYSQKNWLVVGNLVRTYGVKGALVLRLVQGIQSTVLDEVEWCFLMVRNKPVPFRMEEVLATGEQDIVLQLKGVNDKPGAEHYLNMDLAIEARKKKKGAKAENMFELTGYTVYNDGEKAGTILAIEDTGAQLLFVLEDDVLIPAHENLIDKIDDRKKIVYMNLPEGLLE